MSGVRKEGVEGVQDEVRYTYAFEYDGNNNPIFIGKTFPGKSKAEPTWWIEKLTFDGNNNVTDIQHANGDLNFTNVWNDRAALSYS